MTADPDNILTPRRRILVAVGPEVRFPPELVGDFEGIKKLLGFPYAEIVRLPDYGPEGDWIMLLDEEGKLKKFPMLNMEATRLYLKADVAAIRLALRKGANLDVIVGNVAIVRESDFPQDDEEDDNED